MLEEFQHGDVREIRLARTPANSLEPILVTQLTNRLRAASLESAQAVVLSGMPGMFCSGLDVPTLTTLEWNDLQRFLRTVFAMLHQLAQQPIPVVSAITGHCFATGAVMAAICDYRIMAAGNFKIGVNEVTIGLPPARMTYRALQMLIGTREANRLVARGECLTPDEALRIGLVDRVVVPDQVIPIAIEYAQSFTKLPQQALYEARRVCRTDLVAACEDASSDYSEQLHRRWLSDEAQRGLMSLAARLSNE